jgi:hypothetical protein
MTIDIPIPVETNFKTKQPPPVNEATAVALSRIQKNRLLTVAFYHG